MDAVRKGRSRLKLYPELVAQCKSEGAVYAACVVQQENVKLNSCSKEFDDFKKCLMKAAAKAKTKL